MNRQQSLKQKGAGRLAFLFLLALVAAVVYVVAVFVPGYLAAQNMQETAAEIIHRGAAQKLSDADIRAQLHEKAREFGLPEDRRVELWHEGQGLVARISYTRSVTFPFYTYKWPTEIRVKDVGF